MKSTGMGLLPTFNRQQPAISFEMDIMLLDEPKE